MLNPLVLAAALAAESSIGGQAPDQMQDKADLRCILAFARLAEATEGEGADDEASLAPLGSAIMYFLGRIDGRSPGFDFAAALAATKTDPSPAPDAIAGDMARCTGELEMVGDRFELIGAAVERGEHD